MAPSRVTYNMLLFLNYLFAHLPFLRFKPFLLLFVPDLFGVFRMNVALLLFPPLLFPLLLFPPCIRLVEGRPPRCGRRPPSVAPPCVARKEVELLYACVQSVRRVAAAAKRAEGSNKVPTRLIKKTVWWGGTHRRKKTHVVVVVEKKSFPILLPRIINYGPITYIRLCTPLLLNVIGLIVLLPRRLVLLLFLLHILLRFLLLLLHLLLIYIASLISRLPPMSLLPPMSPYRLPLTEGVWCWNGQRPGRSVSLLRNHWKKNSSLPLNILIKFPRLHPFIKNSIIITFDTDNF